jgi:hypothetical protein
MSDRLDTRDLIEWLEAQDPEDDSYDEAECEQVAWLIKDLEENCDEQPRYGIQLIPKNDFKEYAQEFADDCGLLKDNLTWPYTCIDWDWAANELAVDYYEVEFRGVTYLAR